MTCPYCHSAKNRVVDSRFSKEGAIRRRRECLACQRRFTTYERIEEVPLWVRKKDNRRESFDPSKILKGLEKACEKRPVPFVSLEQLSNEVEKELRNRNDPEIASSQIGELVMGKLKDLDEVAYVRFASVYRQFQDVGSFLQELKKIVRGSHTRQN